VQQWIDEEDGVFAEHIATRSAQWGADQELEACCEVLSKKCMKHLANMLRSWRRPEPPSLKEQALAQLSSVETDLRRHGIINTDYIRRAIEALPNDCPHWALPVPGREAE
jgi:hypothetical protein